MSTNKVSIKKIGVIGCGGHSRGQVMRTLSAANSKAIEFSELTDINISSAKSLGDDIFHLTGKPVKISEISEFLEDTACDLIYICTPHASHYEIIKSLLHRKIPVISEKILGLSVNECEELYALSTELNVPLSVAYPVCFSKPYQELKHLAASGIWGEFKSAVGWVTQNWVKDSANTWRTQISQSGGGFSFDTGAHGLHLVLDFLNDSPKNISSKVNKCLNDMGVVPLLRRNNHRNQYFT